MFTASYIKVTASKTRGRPYNPIACQRARASQRGAGRIALIDHSDLGARREGFKTIAAAMARSMEKEQNTNEQNNNGARPVLARTRTRDFHEGKPVFEQVTPHILVVDDEQMICRQLQRLYTRSGYGVDIATSAEEALARLERRDIDLVVTDVRLPGMSGIDLITRMQEMYPDIGVIVITGYAAIESAVEVLKRGASDYIIKPFSAEAIQESTEAVLEKARVFIDIRHLRRSLKGGCEFGGMLSKTPEMHQVFETIRMVSPTDMTVLIEGETGTGKELVARAIHYQSPRREGPFVTINFAGLPESLL